MFNYRANGMSLRCFKNINDTTPPVISDVTKTPTSPTSGSVSLTVLADDGTGVGLHATAYSFDTGMTRQTGNTANFTSNQFVQITVRDGVGNIATTGIVIDNILFPSCDTPDIQIGNYTIQACNLGASTAGTGSASYGNYFQWGNNYGFPTTGNHFLSGTAKPDASSYGPNTANGFYKSGYYVLS
jgi:hypothetical protein